MIKPSEAKWVTAKEITYQYVDILISILLLILLLILIYWYIDLSTCFDSSYNSWVSTYFWWYICLYICLYLFVFVCFFCFFFFFFFCICYLLFICFVCFCICYFSLFELRSDCRLSDMTITDFFCIFVFWEFFIGGVSAFFDWVWFCSSASRFRAFFAFADFDFGW